MKSGCFIPALILLLLLGLTTVVAFADTLRVPEDYPTLQEAADASSPGDIIDLAPGTWYQNVWGLSGVTLKGREGATQTIIDGSKWDWSPIVIYGDPCTIDGLTIRNGIGSNIFGIIRGGAIYAEFTSVTIKNCRFENNSLTMGEFDQAAIGGAVCGFYSPLSFTNCDFLSNTADSGGAIHSEFADQLQIENCRFRSNTAWSGGAIHINNTPFTITSSLFYDNLGGAQGGALNVDAPPQGGPSLTGSVQGCEFIRNNASEYGYGAGGAISVLGNHDVTASGCSFQDNYGCTGGGIFAGYLASGEQPMPVGNSLFCGNYFTDYSYKGVEDDGTNTFTQSCWCSGDIDADEMIGVNDLLLLLDAWGGYYHPDLDANNDAVFDVNDILAVVEAWGRICNDNS